MKTVLALLHIGIHQSFMKFTASPKWSPALMPSQHRKPLDFVETRGIASSLALEETMCHLKNAYATTLHFVYVTNNTCFWRESFYESG